MPEIQKVRWNHEAIIDMMIANPQLSQGEIAAMFGYSQAWLSIIINSDAFQEKLAERRDEIINPALRATVEDRLRAVASRAAEVILDKLNAAPDAKTAIAALEVTSRALGYGYRAPEVSVSVQPVAVVPAKELSSDAWASTFSPRPATPEVIDALPVP